MNIFFHWRNKDWHSSFFKWYNKEKQKKLKIGEEEAFKLVNKPKKFEKSIMIAGGINFHRLNELNLLEGAMNEFYCAKELLFYKEN